MKNFRLHPDAGRRQIPLFAFDFQLRFVGVGKDFSQQTGLERAHINNIKPNRENRETI